MGCFLLLYKLYGQKRQKLCEGAKFTFLHVKKLQQPNVLFFAGALNLKSRPQSVARNFFLAICNNQFIAYYCLLTVVKKY